MRVQIFEIASKVRGEMLFAVIGKIVGSVAFSLCEFHLRDWSIVRAFIHIHTLKYSIRFGFLYNTLQVFLYNTMENGFIKLFINQIWFNFIE